MSTVTLPTLTHDWEGIKCTGCGHEYIRERGIRICTLPCAYCQQPMVAIPMTPLGETASTLRAAADQQRAAASKDPDVVRRARREGRAEAFTDAIDVITATAPDPLRSDSKPAA